MANKQKLADQIRANAEMAKGEEKKRKGGKTGLPKSASSKAYVPPHRHCAICNQPISISRDPPVCGETKCESEYEGRQRQKKRFNIVMVVGIMIMITITMLQILKAGGA